MEVIAKEPQEMIVQADRYSQGLAYEHLAIQIPISARGMSFTGVVRELSHRGLAVNRTACITPMQTLAAAAAGARFTRVLYNGIRDGSLDQHHKERGSALATKLVEEADLDPIHVLADAPGC